MRIKTLKDINFTWSRWSGLIDLSSKQITCGFCGNRVGAHKGFTHSQNSSTSSAYIYICPVCGNPTLFINNIQIPEGRIGRVIEFLPEDVETIYEEMNSSYQHNNYTAVLLLGRKLIMHIAATKANAKEGLNFVEYIDILEDANLLPATYKTILDKIRKLGNQQNHKLVLGTRDNAKLIIKFIEVLLINLYELPNQMNNDEEE